MFTQLRKTITYQFIHSPLSLPCGQSQSCKFARRGQLAPALQLGLAPQYAPAQISQHSKTDAARARCLYTL